MPFLSKPSDKKSNSASSSAEHHQLDTRLEHKVVSTEGDPSWLGGSISLFDTNSSKQVIRSESSHANSFSIDNQNVKLEADRMMVTDTKPSNPSLDNQNDKLEADRMMVTDTKPSNPSLDNQIKSIFSISDILTADTNDPSSSTAERKRKQCQVNLCRRNKTYQTCIKCKRYTCGKCVQVSSTVHLCKICMLYMM